MMSAQFISFQAAPTSRWRCFMEVAAMSFGRNDWRLTTSPASSKDLRGEAMMNPYPFQGAPLSRFA